MRGFGGSGRSQGDSFLGRRCPELFERESHSVYPLSRASRGLFFPLHLLAVAFSESSQAAT